MTAKTSTFILGIIFLILGIVGFIPGLTMHHMHSDIAVTEGMGLELGLFPVNVLHNIVHIFFGVWGLLAARTFPASRFYGRATLVIYAILVVMGLIESAQINTAFGLVPLYNNDVWLHLLIALAGLYIGWIARGPIGTGPSDRS